MTTLQCELGRVSTEGRKGPQCATLRDGLVQGCGALGCACRNHCCPWLALGLSAWCLNPPHPSHGGRAPCWRQPGSSMRGAESTRSRLAYQGDVIPVLLWLAA